MESCSSLAVTQPNSITAAEYQQAIIDTLLDSIPENLITHTLQIIPVFDRQSHRYQLLCQGWNAGEKRIFYPVIHIEIVDDIWIQHNQTDLDIGEALANRGIPKSKIILGLHPPSIRQLNSEYGSDASTLIKGEVNNYPVN